MLACFLVEFAPQNSSTGNTEIQTDIEQPIDGDQGKNENAEMVLSSHCEAPVPNTLKSETHSEDAICENDRSTTKPSEIKLVESNSSETKVVQKRKKSDEVRGGKNAKKSKEDNSNISLLENSAKNKEREKADANVMSLSNLLKTQKKRIASEESNRKKKRVAARTENDPPDTAVREEQKEDNSCSPSTSNLSDSIENQREETVSETKERDRPTGNSTKAEGPCPESGGNGVHKKKDSGGLKNRTNKNVKKKTAGSSLGREPGKGSEELASSSEGSGQNETSGDGLHPENHTQPQKSGFTLKRSSANTDVRVSLTEKVTLKKSLPKLVKAFKPPIAKEGKGPKMPKLLKPQFVSPALAIKKGDKKDPRKEESETKAESNTETKPPGTTKGMKLKSKSPQTIPTVHSQIEKSKESERHQATDVLPG